MNPITPIYYRSIRRGNRTLGSVPDASIRVEIIEYAKQQIAICALFADEFERMTGQSYEEA